MNEAGIAAVGMAAVAMVGTVVNSVIGYRSARDKMQNDSKLLMLEAAERECREDRQECKEETKQIRGELKECRDHHERSELDRQELHRRINEVHDKLNGK